MNVERIRVKTGLTIVEFADKLGLSRGAIYNYEKGQKPCRAVRHLISVVFKKYLEE